MGLLADLFPAVEVCGGKLFSLPNREVFSVFLAEFLRFVGVHSSFITV